MTGHTTVLYYDVEGRTFEELFANIRRQGRQVLGASFVGEARSPMRWSWQIERTGSPYCTIRQVTVSVRAQITLPRWRAPAGAEPGLEAEWNRFIGALELHEAGHKDISARAARDIARKLTGYSGLCSQVGTRANDIARAIADRSDEEQSAYDRTTRHGVTQGTTFGRSGNSPTQPR